MIFLKHAKRFAQQALDEDIGRGDIFRTLNMSVAVTANIIAKEEGIFSGQIYAQALAELAHIDVQWFIEDAKSFKPYDIIAVLQGDFSDILTIERTFLNMIQHSSGIATATNLHIQALNDSTIKILDTRKTHPLLRVFEKYSVRNGGGCNHRFGIDDCVMIKDTHRSHILNLKETIQSIRQAFWSVKVEVESETFEEFKEAIDSGADIVMCDNMPKEDIEKCLQYRNEHAKHILVEVSGGISLSNIHLYRGSGVDAISIGAIIHHAHFIDMSMKIKR